MSYVNSIGRVKNQRTSYLTATIHSTGRTEIPLLPPQELAAPTDATVDQQVDASATLRAEPQPRLVKIRSVKVETVTDVRASVRER